MLNSFHSSYKIYFHTYFYILVSHKKIYFLSKAVQSSWCCLCWMKKLSHHTRFGILMDDPRTPNKNSRWDFPKFWTLFVKVSTFFGKNFSIWEFLLWVPSFHVPSIVMIIIHDERLTRNVSPSRLTLETTTPHISSTSHHRGSRYLLFLQRRTIGWKRTKKSIKWLRFLLSLLWGCSCHHLRWLSLKVAFVASCQEFVLEPHFQSSTDFWWCDLKEMSSTF